MGLDIYAGTLTRYYSGNWKTSTQKWAEENGMEFNTIRPNDDVSNADKASVEEIQKAIQEWNKNVSSSLVSSSGKRFKAWEENNIKDYFTDKPDWCAFGALLLYAACLKYKLPLPKKIKKNWDYHKDKIISRAIKDKELMWSLFSNAEWWLPFDECFIFSCQTPNGNEILAGTNELLSAELKKVNKLGWNANEKTIFEWLETEGYPVDGETKDGEYKKNMGNYEYDVESLAKFAFSILYQAVLFSKKHNVPILMDY